MPDNPKDNNHRVDQNTSMSQNRDWEGENNPFATLRRFADEQVSSMLQSIIGLPSSVSPPQNDQWAAIPRDDDPKDTTPRQSSGTENTTEQNHAGGGSTDDSGDGEKPR
ncbi:hypothetical protein N7492_000586 [Penicillium capsulatum]|uniref:Uncharacterized protein n=1 Tax=Penicillium capsulatum TaxID=69766 RepID=A0A9W9ITT8_9EURO|nr:hypothetical protein N7492_000586 [Penicillium capsulatum]KAJ6130356.1 hypothetical protein N7512_003136 [Penicillium capsulatum]